MNDFFLMKAFMNTGLTSVDAHGLRFLLTTTSADYRTSLVPSNSRRGLTHSIYRAISSSFS
jgi:hypothetical protein